MSSSTAADWETIRPLVERTIGSAHLTRQIDAGPNSDIALVVRSEKGLYFVKGQLRGRPGGVTHGREASVNPMVRHLSPVLQWRAKDDVWDLLGFDFVKGRRANYKPKSRDLHAVLHLILRLQMVRPPNEDTRSAWFKTAPERWRDYTDDPELFAGEALLHTDWNPENVLIVGDRALLVDWTWPTWGARWIDPVCWALWLIASGHDPALTEEWAGHLPSWHDASPAAVTEFIAAQQRMWASIAAERSPAALRDTDRWIAELAEAAAHWLDYRKR